MDNEDGLLGEVDEGFYSTNHATGKVAYLRKVDLISPAGNDDNDPVNKPIDGGNGTGDDVPDGANEFTFSSANPGVLTIKFKAKVEVDATVLEKIKNKFKFTVDSIGQDPTWNASNPEGKATLSDGYLVATATFTGLPANNSDFGKKKVKLLFDGSAAQEAEIEVFFPRDAKNHPEDGSGTTPNWFYYWLQTVTLLGPDPDVGYSTTGSYYDPNINKLFLSDGDRDSYNAPYGNHNPLEGIDNFTWTAIHESQHYKDWNDFWNVESSGITEWQAAYHQDGPTQNKDDDYLPNNEEDLDLDKTFNSGDRYDWAATLTPGAPAAIVNDAEDYTCIRHGGVKGNQNLDWADPGMQHQTIGKYND